MKKIIITSGIEYTDIDGLSCALALRDLLILEGKKSEVVLIGEINHSVTDSVKKLGLDFLSEFTDEEDVSFIVVDVSEPDHIPEFVDLKKVFEVYDHHFGFEKFWQEKIGEKAKIEPVGACATLIWEEYKKRGFGEKISQKNAFLLSRAIISNTLNLKAKIASERDAQALEEMEKYSALNDSDVEKYFSDSEKSIFDDVQKAIANDTKGQNASNVDKFIVISQLELWNGRGFIEKYLKEIEEALSAYNNPDCFITIPSISEGKNYIYTKNNEIKNLLAKTIDAKFENNIGTTSRLWLRKEILKELYQVEK